MKLKKTPARIIWQVEWPENISTAKLAKLLNVSWPAANQFIKTGHLPDRHIATLESAPLTDILK